MWSRSHTFFSVSLLFLAIGVTLSLWSPHISWYTGILASAIANFFYMFLSFGYKQRIRESQEWFEEQEYERWKDR
jgi:hypothetical protein